MLLQELFNEINEQSRFYGITLNEDSLDVKFSSPPVHIKELGFIFKVDDSGLMDEGLMDIVISYRLSNVDIVLEVPVEVLLEKNIEPKYLIQLASNVDFGISILPPSKDSNVTFEQFENVLMQFFNEMLSRPNFDKFVSPISNFLEYLMIEQILGKDKLIDFKPTDEYIVNNYSTNLSVSESDSFKDKIRKRLYDFYEGEENFNLVAKSMLSALLNKSELFFQNYLEQSKAPN